MAHQSDAFTGLDMERKIVKHFFLVGILEINILKYNITLQSRYRLVFQLMYGWISINQGKNAFCSRQSTLELIPE